MSEAATVEKQADGLPAPDEAYNYLFQQVHSPVFFTKLAQAGIQPQNEKEAQSLLELAGKLRSAETDLSKQGTDRFGEAHSALDRALEAQGLGGSVKAAQEQERNAALNQVSEQFAQNADIFNSVLSLKAAEAEEIAQHLQPDADAEEEEQTAQ